MKFTISALEGTFTLVWRSSSVNFVCVTQIPMYCTCVRVKQWGQLLIGYWRFRNNWSIISYLIAVHCTNNWWVIWCSTESCDASQFGVNVTPITGSTLNIILACQHSTKFIRILQRDRSSPPKTKESIWPH